ncbi:hypothetical protein K438DRAFT_1764560 [Mycena galopus ATCC 62051]|nr:hypothetical protein K438DRAFT_1764560 [Mycena galopus ATCC 62051]
MTEAPFDKSEWIGQGKAMADAPPIIYQLAKLEFTMPQSSKLALMPSDRAAARDRGHGSTAPVARVPCPFRWQFSWVVHAYPEQFRTITKYAWSLMWLFYSSEERLRWFRQLPVIYVTEYIFSSSQRSLHGRREHGPCRGLPVDFTAVAVTARAAALPSEFLLVAKMLEFTVPLESPAKGAWQPAQYFSTNAPDTSDGNTVSCLRRPPIPELKVIKKVLAYGEQAWLDDPELEDADIVPAALGRGQRKKVANARYGGALWEEH